MRDRNYDVIILGAGGAGLMCAGIAGQRKKRVLLLDHAQTPGKKILISGGGRCNFTNIDTPANCYLSANPHFAKSALGRYQPEDFIALVNAYSIAWHEKERGQLFCDGSAKQIVAMLLAECEKGQVELRLLQQIGAITLADNLFKVNLTSGPVTTPALVIATGGPSIPKMGASGFAYRLARQFGLGVIEPRPALVPLRLGEGEALFRSLSGVSTETIARWGKVKFRANSLFTHRGLSGPAILQISSYWRKGDQIGINFFPESETGWLVKAKHATPNAPLARALGSQLPDRLASALSDRLDLAGELANISDKKLLQAEHRLNDWLFTPAGSEGYAKAEVTAGGINTRELSSKTMQATKVPGLYVIGEAVDVTGWLGGYNFQWAWSSAWAAGQAV